MSHGQESHDHRRPPPGGAGSGIGGDQECVLCPVCVFLQAVSSTRPEVTRHLVAAGRELTLALQAVLEQHLEAHGEGPDGEPGLERIEVD